ncbi:acyl-CoA dehydrogenase family protein, partial [Bacillus subtilis]
MKQSIYGDEHKAFREAVRQFIDREIRGQVPSYAEAHRLPREFGLAAGRQGLLGLEIPEEYGGSAAGDYRFNAILLAELAAVNMALPSAIGIHADVVPPYLIQLAKPTQRERWLPDICSGLATAAIAMTEPGVGSDLAALSTSAVRSGSGFVINGSKTFITNGYTADIVIVAARTGRGAGSKGITLFAVPSNAEGFSRGRNLDKV